MFIVLMLAGAMIPFSRAAADGAAEGLRVFALTVVPSLFPFIVCADYVHRSGADPLSKVKNRALSGIAFWFLSALFGTPSAAILCESHFAYGRNNAARVTLLCAALNQSGPVFLISALAVGMFGRPEYSLLFAVSHYLPSLLFSSALFIFYPPAGVDLETKRTALTPPLALLSDSISGAVTTMLRIGGTIVFFRTVFSVLEATGLFSCLGLCAKGMLIGAVELTNGLSVLSCVPSRLSLAFCASLLSFGGAAIFIQSKMICPELSGKHYFAAKAVLGAVSGALMWFLAPLCPGSAEVFGDLSESLGAAAAKLDIRTISVLSAGTAAGASLIVSLLYSKAAARR